MTNKPKRKLSIKTDNGSSSQNSEFVTVIKKNISTPIATVHFCGIHKPQFFSGSTIPRYKVSIFLDPNNKTHKNYLDKLETLAVENQVEILGRMDDRGQIMMSYQGREKPKTFILEKGKKNPEEIDLENDLPTGFRCKINFDLKRYFDRYTKKNAFTYTPNKVIFYLDDETEQLINVEEASNGDSENCWD